MIIPGATMDMDATVYLPMAVPLKLDITTGDKMTPKEI